MLGVWLVTAVLVVLAPSQSWAAAAPSPTWDASSVVNADNSLDMGHDGSTSTRWLSAYAAVPAWVRLTYPTAVVVSSYTVSGQAAADLQPKSWKFQGWDGAAWVDLDSVTAHVWSSPTASYVGSVAGTESFTEFRLYISEAYGPTYVGFSELAVTAALPVVPTPTPTPSPTVTVTSPPVLVSTVSLDSGQFGVIALGLAFVVVSGSALTVVTMGRGRHGA